MKINHLYLPGSMLHLSLLDVMKLQTLSFANATTKASFFFDFPLLTLNLKQTYYEKNTDYREGH